MPSGQLVASSRLLLDGTIDSESNDSRLTHVMSDGVVVVISSPSAGGSLGYNWMDPAVGTWSTPTVFITETVATYGYAVVQVGDDINLFSTFGTYLEWDQMTWNTSTNAFGAVTTRLITLSPNPIYEVAACWDSTNSVFHVISFGSPGGTGAWRANAINTSGAVVATGAGFSTSTTLQSYGIRCVPGATTQLYFLHYSVYSSSSQLLLKPISYTASAYTNGVTETVYAGTPVFAACELDSSNNIDVVYIDSSHKLQAVKRTGTNIYGTPINIASGASSATTSSLSLTPDVSGGLYAFYSSVANQTNGEIYVVQRKSGAWLSPSVFAGGDSGGYEVPKSSPGATSGRVDVVYQTPGFTAVYYKSISLGSIPNTPTLISPVTNINSLTPTFSWNYTNSAANDTQGAYEIIVTRVSDSVVMWDSGQVSSSASANIAYGGTALSYGVQYNWKVRTWDSVLLPTQVSAYSLTQPFTAYHSPSGVITQITAFGLNLTSSPAIIQASTIIATVTYSQPDGNAGNAYKLTLYALDGVTVIDSTAFITLSPTVANGGSFVTDSWTPKNILNNNSYKLKVTVVDSVTGVTADSAFWQLNTSWAPPVAPSAFSATPVPDAGYIQLAWTNDASAATVNVYRRPGGTPTWTTLSSGQLLNGLVDFAPLGQIWDYGVQSVNSSGVVSSISTDTSNILGPKFGTYGFWLNDVTDPNDNAVALGIYDTPDLIFQWQHVEDPNSFVAQGRSKPIITYGKTDYWTATQNKFLVLDTDTGASGEIVLGFNLLNMLYQMAGSHMTLLYRDPYGHSRFVNIQKPLIKRHDISSWSAELDFTELDYPKSFVTA